jgi:anti-sigma28 factor (negative regulator of flagellin synthesis)
MPKETKKTGSAKAKRKPLDAETVEHRIQEIQAGSDPKRGTWMRRALIRTALQGIANGKVKDPASVAEALLPLFAKQGQ